MSASLDLAFGEVQIECMLNSDSIDLLGTSTFLGFGMGFSEGEATDRDLHYFSPELSLTESGHSLVKLTSSVQNTEQATDHSSLR